MWVGKIFSSSVGVRLELGAVDVLGGGEVVFIMIFFQAVHRRSVHERR